MNVLKQNSLTELKQEELIEIDGGRIKIPGPWGWIVTGVYYIVDEWDDISAGFEEGYKDAKK